MKSSLGQMLFAALAILTTSLAQNAQAQLVGLWDFENGSDLTAASIGADLALTGTDLAVPGSGGSDAGGSQLDVGDFYTVTHGIAPNGGGSFVNEWTLVLDVSYPASSVGSYMTFYQTKPANDNDGDAFIRNANPTGAIGVGATGYSTNTTAADTWYRVVFSVDNGKFHKTYVDGNLWVDGGDQGIDGRFSLDPTLLLFADNDGDDATINVSNAALFDTPLSSYQVSALGVAGDAIAFTPNPVLQLIINRDDGTMTLANGNLGAAQAIKGYSILSSAGALIEANYTPLADTDSNWVQFSASGATGDLSEGHLTTGSIANQASIPLDDGANGAWLQYYDESDVTFQYLNGDGALIQGDVTFTGTTQTSPFEEGDLNFDGSVNGLDWNAYVAGLGADLSGMSAAQSYRDGDLTGDLVNNHDDFLAFQNAYNAANGAGAFQALISTVPEPSSLLMLTMAGLIVGGIRLRRNVATGMVAVACLFAISSQAQAQLVGLWEFQNGSDLGKATIGSDMTATLTTGGNTGTISAVAGSGGSDTGAAEVTKGAYFTAATGIAPNGGGTKVNQYSLLFDVSYPTASVGQWRTLYSTDPDITASDGEFFIHPSDESWGVAALGYTDGSHGTFFSSANTWYRAVLTVDAGNATSLYINGTQVSDYNADALDGRFALDSVVHFLGDNDGDDAALDVSNLALFDRTLNPLQAELLGSAGDPIAFFNPQLTLNVNKTTGRVTMTNESGLDIPKPINFYEIISGDGVGGDGTLSTASWNSFSDQSGVTAGIDPVASAAGATPGAGNDPGETWDEGGGSDADLLTEAFLSGSTSFDDSFSVDLGNIYTGGNSGAEDLSFNFSLVDGTTLAGVVNYFTSVPSAGDFTGDGDVDGADFLSWQRGNSPNNGSPADLVTWQDNYGNSSSAATTVAGIPEPTSWLLLCIGLAGVGLATRRG